MVSFIQLREDEKLGRYGEFKERRLNRGLKTMSVKGYVNTISKGEFHQGAVPITFSDQDLETIKMPHVDPLIIKLRIGSAMVYRVLVDGGSSSYILFWETFQRVEIDKEMIWPIITSLHAFNGVEVKPLRVVALPVYSAD